MMGWMERRPELAILIGHCSSKNRALWSPLCDHLLQQVTLWPGLCGDSCRSTGWTWSSLAARMGPAPSLWSAHSHHHVMGSERGPGAPRLYSSLGLGVARGSIEPCLYFIPIWPTEGLSALVLLGSGEVICSWSPMRN